MVPSITVTSFITTLGSGLISIMVPVFVKSCAPTFVDAATPKTFKNSFGSFKSSILVGMLNEVSVFGLPGSVVSSIVKVV